MWQFTLHSGFATLVLDYSHELSLLGYGLFGLLAFSGGMIALVAIRHHLSRISTLTATRTSPHETYDTAA